MHTSLLLIVLVTLPMAVDAVVGETGCGGPRKECMDDSECPAKWTCLGTYENSHCYKCECNSTSQCYLAGSSWACDCANTDGDYGTDCKCPPEENPGCVDVFSVYGMCGEFSNTFQELSDIKINTENEGNATSFDGYETSAENCRSRCISDNCHVYTYGADDCAIFYKEFTSPLTNILSRIRDAEDYTLYINECAVC